MSTIIGCPYPIVKNSLGFLSPQRGIDQVKSDLLILLLTNPGERVMMPNYGTPLRRYLFDQNDPTTAGTVRDLIANSIKTWEPRITVKSITVTDNVNEAATNPSDTVQATDVLGINIEFFDPGNIKDVQNLSLQIPIPGA